MTIYSVIILFTFLSFLYFYKRPSNIGYNFVFVSIALVICFGYMCGSDWRAYETIYNSYSDPSLGGFWWRFLYVEPLYMCLNIIGNELHMNFWVWYIFIKLLIYIKIVQLFKRFCPREIILLAFTFYLGFWGIMHFIDPSFRNMIAAYLFLCSIDSLLNRNFKKYLLWVFAATLIHYSSIILILFYFILNRSYSNKSIIILYVIASILLIKPDVIFNVLSSLFSFVPAISMKIDNYAVGNESTTLGQGKLISVGYFIHLVFFVIIMYSRRRIEAFSYGKFLFNMSVLFVFVFRIGLTALVFSRLQLFISYFYAITVAIVIYSFAEKYRLLFATYVCVIALLANGGQMKNVFFTPYTNYFMYIDRNMSFEERAAYNFKNSPYKY